MEKMLKKDGITKTLGLSDSADDWIQTGKVSTATSIQPYQTYYKLTYSELSAKLKGKYSSLLLPDEDNTQYWVASRCVDLGSDVCFFRVRYVYAGGFGTSHAMDSHGNPGSYSRPLFPVVSLAASLIDGDATAGWSVE